MLIFSIWFPIKKNISVLSDYFICLKVADIAIVKIPPIVSLIPELWSIYLANAV